MIFFCWRQKMSANRISPSVDAICGEGLRVCHDENQIHQLTVQQQALDLAFSMMKTQHVWQTKSGESWSEHQHGAKSWMNTSTERLSWMNTNAQLFMQAKSGKSRKSVKS